MSTFEAEVSRLVAAFLAELVELARLAARDMVHKALVRTPNRKHRIRSNSVADMSRMLRKGLVHAVGEFEQQCIIHELRKHKGNITHAATALRVSRQSLQRKMRRLRVPASIER